MARLGQSRRATVQKRTERAPPKPLDARKLDELALAYVARFATSRGKLSAYLTRKLRERGWDGEGDPPVAALVERMSEFGYVDDAAFARAKSGSLLRRGYGARRVADALGADGIDGALRAQVAPGEGDQRRAALALARKRRFGPFGAGAVDRAVREKQIAAMLRAGHRLDSIRALFAAPDIAEAEAWAYGADEAEEQAE